jgi:hypothetical protein
MFRQRRYLDIGLSEEVETGSMPSAVIRAFARNHLQAMWISRASTLLG